MAIGVLLVSNVCVLLRYDLRRDTPLPCHVLREVVKVDAKAGNG